LFFLEKTSTRELNAKGAFDLFQSYGFPIEMTEELAQEKGINIDKKGFEKEKPTFTGQIKIPAVMSGVSVKVPDNPIINGKYNVFFQIRTGHNPTKSEINSCFDE
jgi:hypothetical protein